MQWNNIDGFDFRGILYQYSEGIAKLTINRPEVRNAFRLETIQQLSRAFHDAHMNPDIGSPCHRSIG